MGLLIYTPVKSSRITYILRLLLTDVLKIKYRLVDDRSFFESSDEAYKLIYGNQKIVQNSIFFRSSPFMLESDLKNFIPKVCEHEDTPILFPVEESDLPFDPFAASFYMVSRYEEYLSFNPDFWGRYSATNSLAFKYGFLEKPVVNMWANLLKHTILKKYPHFKFEKTTYSFNTTLDLDNTYAFIGKPLYRICGAYVNSVLKGNYGEFIERTKVLLGKKQDPFDTYDYQKKIHQKYSLSTIYFLLLGDHGKYDKNISFRNKQYKKLVSDLKASNTSLGMHPSYKSNSSDKQLKKEYDRFNILTGKKALKSRQHYVKLIFPETYRRLIKLGITEDYSMGFADLPGFRAGICTPFNFYDIHREEETPLKIYPFQIMDATLKYYMKLSPDSVLLRIKPIIDGIKSVNGNFTLLWHNESISGKIQWEGWGHLYEEIIKEAVE